MGIKCTLRLTAPTLPHHHRRPAPAAQIRSQSVRRPVNGAKPLGGDNLRAVGAGQYTHASCHGAVAGVCWTDGKSLSGTDGNVSARRVGAIVAETGP
jgi:hypothetical protein